MVKNEEGIIRYAPLYIHTFRVLTPKTVSESQIYNIKYLCYEDIKNVTDRIQWCRHNLGLKQAEVAKRIGISRTAYGDIESGAVNYYPKNIVDKLAALYHVSPMDLLDDYNLFLYKGQARSIRECRNRLGLKRHSFAKYLGIDSASIYAWESERVLLSKISWEKYFKELV